ncbi:2-amino-4-hydroxy-6-hydroxymethyldihydropteridine diphosphokinase [Acinetobacter calcoaceticus]|uniref:2-amino-4-hydroxy-6-hydroxymethyldihydropteridine diphosphokinase n=1 Tax=Acinetobacter calcoaceticus TaxID=471 RepID=A0A4R1XHF1_ACICA|nr:2-amino-4-hydroxy-6-hydroxymethyldihydropteridine diphosphokinase [Acinetobacter calcoaceticus]
MNATDTIYALALASNQHPEQHFRQAIAQLQGLGRCQFSSIYKIPCRDGIGADYWNCACLLCCDLSVEQLSSQLKQWENDSGRVRPSHQISLDVDLIAWGTALTAMQLNRKKLPLPLDVKIPMYQIWNDPAFQHPAHHYPNLSCLELATAM